MTIMTCTSAAMPLPFTMSTPRSHVRRPLSSALSLATAPASTSSSSAFKAASPQPTSTSRLARCYPPSPAVHQSSVRSFYQHYRDVAAVWRQCNLDCTAAVQSIANSWLQLAEQCHAASGDWGVFAQQPAVRQAVERQTRQQLHNAIDEATERMSELTDCYATLQSASRSLHSQHEQWLNAVLAATDERQSEQQAEDWLSCPLFDRGSCSMSAFLPLADELLAMYRKELTLKQATLAHIVDIARQTSTVTAASTDSVSATRVVLEQYMSCWTLEPFLQAEHIEEIGRVWQSECPTVATGAAS